MSKILVIVESAGKINKISSYLGDGYIVKASIGHVQELDKKTSFEILLKKSYFKNLEDLVKRHHSGFEFLTDLLLAIEANDIKSIEQLKKLFAKSICAEYSALPSLSKFAASSADFAASIAS